MKKLVVLIAALGVPSLAWATEAPQPTAWTTRVQPLESVERVVMPAVDEARLKAEDERRAADTLEKSLRYAENLKVDLSPDNAGTWERLPGGELLWRLRVQSKRARSLNFGFDQYFMPAGGRLFIYSLNGKHVYRPFTDRDNEDHGQLWTPPVFGEETVLEVTLPESARPALKLHLALVNHDYRGFGQPGMEKSGACNIDVVCPIGDVYNDQDRASAVISTGGGTFCSGSLVNNTANDARPFFLTAAHCGITAGNAASLVTFWNYQNSICRPVGSPESGGPGDGQLNQFNTGSFFRAAFGGSDVTLVELDDAPLPAFNVFLAGWDRSDNPTQFPATVAIHHPSTDEKRITFAPGMTESGGWPPAVPGDGSHIHAIWGVNLGVTEPGSSGSPLYTQQGRYIGQLHGGPSACGAGDLSDYYGRFSTSWTGGGTNSTRLSNWLDPGNTGVITLNGINGCTAPAAPAGVTATATTPNTIQVAWSAVGGATGYNVYRSNGSCPGGVFSLVGNNVAGLSFNDTTVSGGNTYSYVVRTISVCESVNSNCDDATATGTCTTPPTFAGLASVTPAGTPSCALNLAWTAGTTGCVGSTLNYNVYRSTVSGFVPGPANLRQSCVAGTSFSDTTVASGTTYYYVVRAEDSTANGTGPCNSGNQELNTVERSGAPFGASTTVTDNVEAGGANWNTAGGVGTNVWTIVTDLSNSPTHSWKVLDPAIVTDQRLTTAAPGNIPAAFVMSWFQRYNTEVGAGTVGFDGHVLEYSLNGGATWTDILAAQAPVPANPGRFLMNGYTHTISSGFASPLAGRLAWSGDNAAFQQVQVNLADFSGLSPLFRFRFASDNSVADVGVWIDDITFRLPGACGGPAFVRGDFNSDGKTDILWRHDESGQNVLWYMNGTVLASGEFTTPEALTDVRWKMVGTHDFNADNKNDILWRHNVAGQNVLWYMNGSVLTTGEFLTPAELADTNWQMAGTGDFNGDNKPDIAWHHQTAAQIVVWFMNGSVLQSGTFTSPSTMDINYRLVGVADFSNPLDGKPDFVWRHQGTGQNLFWLMNGVNQTASVPTSTLSDTGWELVATGDFNQDGKNDFVWRHQTSGQNVSWFMNGTTFVSGTFLTPPDFPDTRWKMVGPR